MGRRTAAVTATVREWYDEEGWGVLDSPETPPGGCFGHYSDIHAPPGFRTLSPGQKVDLTWEAPPGFKQDGYDYRAVSITPPSAPDIYGRRWIADEQETAGPRKASPAASVFSHFSGMDSGLL